MRTDVVKILDVLFSDLGEDEFVCVSLDAKFNCQVAHRDFQRWLEDPTLKESWFVNLSTVRGIPRSKKLKRTNDQCVRVHAIVLDDIGEADKSICPRTDVPVDPTFIIETSPKNYQYFYKIDATDDFQTYNKISQAMADKGLTDPKAVGHNRLVRLPGSLNAKHNGGI